MTNSTLNTGCIEARDVAGDPTHFLLGQRLHDAATIELRLADGSWLRGYYDYRLAPDRSRVPVFNVVYAYESTSNPHPDPITAVFDLPQDALLRWPHPDSGAISNPLPPRSVSRRP
jgi:hypothetical protein